MIYIVTTEVMGDHVKLNPENFKGKLGKLVRGYK